MNHKKNIKPSKAMLADLPDIVARLNSSQTSMHTEAKRYGVHHSTISLHRRSFMGDTWYSLKHLSKLQQDKDLIMGLYEAGFTPEKIRNKLDEYEVSSSSVRNFINKHKKSAPKAEELEGIETTTLSDIHNCNVDLNGETLLLKRRQKIDYVLVPKSEYLQLKSNTETK